MLIVATVHHGNGNTIVARYIASAVDAVNNVVAATVIGCAGGVIAVVVIAVAIIVTVRWVLTYAQWVLAIRQSNASLDRITQRVAIKIIQRDRKSVV